MFCEDKDKIGPTMDNFSNEEIIGYYANMVLRIAITPWNHLISQFKYDHTIWFKNLYASM